jgi:hypothetical protein
MRPIPPAAADQHGVFSTAQAKASGWTQENLDYAVRRGRLARIQRGCYQAAPSRELSAYDIARDSALTSSIAATLMHPLATISHSAAAVRYGLPTLEARPRPCVTMPATTHGRAARVHLHRNNLAPGQRLRLSPSGSNPLPTTSVARTCVDIARESGRDAAVIVADAALARRMMYQSELASIAADLRGIPGSLAALQLPELADARSESPLESISRLVFLDAGSRPDLQVPIYNHDGALVARVDFGWAELGVVGEADGRMKYLDLPRTDVETSLWDEKQRQDRLADLGLVVIRWGWREAINSHLLLAKLNRGICRAQFLRAAGLAPAPGTFGPPR